MTDAVLLGAPTLVWHGLVQALEMLWATLWALVLGFLVSGAVRCVVPGDALRARLGDHSLRATARATAYGAASSSCSYSAAATSRTLLAQGADVVTSVVFLVASTNLVIELGAVILGLLGWRFLAAQLAGGVVLVVLLVVLGAPALRSVAAGARARVGAAGEGRSIACHDEAPSLATAPVASLVAPDTWRRAARAGLDDARMVRREVLVGFLLAGLLAAGLPEHAWADVFVRGHGAWTALENVLVAPLVAMASCVCSVGNVPLATVLWHGGIGFAGTLAFLFSDVLALPLVLIYRRFYGRRFTVRLVALLYVSIVLAALGVAGLASIAGLAPASPAAAPSAIAVPAPVLTAALNVLALGLAGALLWSGRRRPHAEAAPPAVGRGRSSAAP